MNPVQIEHDIAQQNLSFSEETQALYNHRKGKYFPLLISCVFGDLHQTWMTRQDIETLLEESKRFEVLHIEITELEWEETFKAERTLFNRGERVPHQGAVFYTLEDIKGMVGLNLDPSKLQAGLLPYDFTHGKERYEAWLTFEEEELITKRCGLFNSPILVSRNLVNPKSFEFIRSLP